MTISNIDADYDGSSDGTTKQDTETILRLNGPSTPWRFACRFSLSVISSGSTVSNTSFQCNRTSGNIESPDQVNLNAYNSTGDDDPSSDSAATFNTRCAGTTLASETTNYYTNGSKTTDLGTTADGQVQGNITSPGRWSLGATHTSFTGSEGIAPESIENSGSDPPTLIVDWTSSGVTVTVAATLDELTAALNVSHGQTTTLQSTIDELVALLSITHGQAVTLAPLLDAVQASFSVSHGQELTIVSTLREMQAALQIETAAPAAEVTIQTTLRELAASLNVSHGQELTIVSMLDEVSASLNVGQILPVTIASTLDEVIASLNISHGQQLTIVSTLDEVQASLNIQQPFTITIASTLDEVMASLSIISGYQINIASVLDKVFASLNVSHGQQLTIASTLDEVMASLNITHVEPALVTIATTLRELLASLQISHGQRITIASSLDEVQAHLELGQIQQVLIAVLLDELTAVLNVEVGAHIPVAGTFVGALRERTLHFVRPRDPAPTRYDREGLMRLRPR